MKGRHILAVIGIAATTVGAGALTGCSSSSAGASGGASPGATVAADSGVLLPVDSDPIVNTATKPGLEITSIMVENNVDPATQQDLPDQLQMDIHNGGDQTMSDLDVFYQMTDTTTKQTEGYYQKLTGLALAPGETATVFFDGGDGAGHYPENPYSLYRTSQNEVTFNVRLSTPGYKVATATVAKAVGTGEVAGE